MMATGCKLLASSAQVYGHRCWVLAPKQYCELNRYSESTHLCFFLQGEVNRNAPPRTVHGAICAVWATHTQENPALYDRGVAASAQPTR
jgi:hypothetical protein